MIIDDVGPNSFRCLLEVIYSDEVQTIAYKKYQECSELVACCLKYAPNLLKRTIQSSLNLHETIEPSSLQLDMFDCLQQWPNQFADITFVIENQYPIHLHKAIMCARSEYFRALISGGMKESQLKEIPLVQINLPTFNLIRVFCYSNQIAEISDEAKVSLSQLLDLYEFSQLYLIETLQNLCEDELRIRSKTNPNIEFDTTEN